MTETAQNPDRPENIILVGFMGSGKSTVGRMLARQLRFRFLDTDKLVEQRARMAIPEIFAQYGEADFRERETAELESLAGLRRHILATGGGIVTVPENIPLLRSLGLVVLLKADPDEIYRRVSRNSERPLLQVEDPRKRVSRSTSARRISKWTAHGCGTRTWPGKSWTRRTGFSTGRSTRGSEER
jgi:shikimate kinase